MSWGTSATFAPPMVARLLGRQQRAIDFSGLRSFFEGKSVLVTGAGGSIGSEVCRRLMTLGCRRVSALDFSDHALIELISSLQGAANYKNFTEIMCDVRDPARLEACMMRARPDLVIHAAALKHVHMGDRHPTENVLTNFVGARNAVEAAARAGADRFLLISSDKAAAPNSVMGAAKRLSELLMVGRAAELAAERCDTKLASVRFGNVFGSQGSVAQVFAAQIAAGGPVTVTHRDMRRYFMTLDEAAYLILAVASGDFSAGSYLLDMGEPVRIMDLAKRMIAEYGQETKVKIVGLREGEKLDEVLFDSFEALEPAGQTGVLRIRPLRPSALGSAEAAELERVVRASSDDIIRHRIFALLDEHLGSNDHKAAAG